MLKKILITFAVLASLVGLYAASGFYLLPKLARDKLPGLLTELTGLPVQLQDAHFNPFKLTADLQGFDLSTTDGKSVLNFTELAVDVAFLESVKQRAVVFTSAVLQKPVANLERQADGRFNFSDLIDKVSQPDQEHKPDNQTGSTPILIHQLTLDEGRISWLDTQAGQDAKETLLPVNFSVAEFTTAPDAKSTFSFGFGLDSGGGLDWQGDINLSSLSSTGHIKLDNLKLNKVWLLFLQDLMSLEIADGLLSLEADYAFNSNEQAGLVIQVDKGSLNVEQLAFNQTDKASQLIGMSFGQILLQTDVSFSSDQKSGMAVLMRNTAVDVKKLTLSETAKGGGVLDVSAEQLLLQADVSVKSDEKSDVAVVVENGSVDVKQLTLQENGKAEKLIDMPILEARGVDFDLQKQTVKVARLSGGDAKINAWLQADGQLNYQALLGADASATEPAPVAEATGKPWQFSLGELALSNYQLEFVDHTQPKPQPMLLSQLNVTIKDYSSVDSGRLPVQFSTRFNKAGSVKLDGDMVLAPFSANLALDLQAIKLKTFQAYVDPFLKLELVDGDLNTKGHIQLSVADEVQVGFQGDANIDHLITRDKANNQDFVKWASLELKQIVIDVQKQDFKLGRVILNRPYMKFMIKKDGTNNVSDIIVAETKQTNKLPVKKSKKALKTPEPVITIGKIEMKKGQSDFADYSLILPFVAKMNDLNGEIDGFISNANATTKLKLQGKVYDLAPVKIAGNYHFKTGDSDITLNFSHMPLPLITPYMAEFAGYTIEKGQMALDLKYSIKKGKLTAQNKIFIDQLVLGGKVENPKAVSMPLKLGVALLKDADGKINLDFPITGSLEDPEFSVGSLVANVFVNLITKAATSPFKAMASLFDSSADMSRISFAAGSSELSAEERIKLDQIGKALASKPALVLEIKGIAYEIQDWPVMRFDAVVDILKKMKSGELREYGDNIRSEYIELSDDDYKRLLEKFYTEVFPQRIEHSLFGSPRIKSNPDGDFYSLARAELEAIMQPDPERLNDLAVSRSNHIAKYLTEQIGVDRSRIYILATELNNTDTDGGINAMLSLNVAS
ncbi:MAG: DUF748 domain-containing protein [Methylomonas sp.]|jgi:hypothetical protein|uniref:DUF748 domain-containing protein n=1 Tax=Methylomonas sp. TaxID=418 RepID=UPI0025FC3027|nr:DUF748 domain-containing protein [Methylomonas sp.]MCK9606761.1 DUF748 domain-containing protein [Methylomonas sp.]